MSVCDTLATLTIFLNTVLLNLALFLLPKSLTWYDLSSVHDSRQAILLDHEKELERRLDDEYEGSEEEVFGLEGDEDEEEEDEDDLDGSDGDIGNKEDEEDVMDLDSKLLYLDFVVMFKSYCHLPPKACC
jgi:hypothetical protein